MKNLPIFQDPNRNFMLHQTSWNAAITPIIQNELNQGLLINNIPLTTGDNVINTLLSRTQIGWMITDINAGAVIYRNAPLNDKTLTLNSSADCIVSIWMF